MRGGCLIPCVLHLFPVVGWTDMKPYLIKRIKVKVNGAFEELKINVDPKSSVCIPIKKP